MLLSLVIQNYAIIDEIEIKFSSNLNIITGETGAGKSIVIGALSLILGERADSSVLLQPGKKCFIEGIFKTQNRHQIITFLNDNDLQSDDDEIVLRREINAAGKSRAFINDSPATLQQLKKLASMLVDLHQQFNTLELGDADFQREVLDALAKNNNVLNNYQQAYNNYRLTLHQLEDLKRQKADFTKEFDYQQFLFNELDELDLKENELELLEEELKVMSNAEDIKTKLSQSIFRLKESDEPLTQSIKQIIQQLQSVAGYHSGIAGITERMQSAYLELADVAGELENVSLSIHFDANRIEEINERISSGYRLQKKHGVQSTRELIQIKNDLENKLLQVMNIDSIILEKESTTAKLYSDAQQFAEILSAERKKIVAPFTKNVNALLKQVGMPNAKIAVSLTPVFLNDYGLENIEFLFDANNTGRMQPLNKVASGGELSRLMLCIKSLVAESINLPTLIFDEIDSGISGEAAKQVGIIMKSLADKRQVISITHQPQIAGKANKHFYVFKEIKDNAIVTRLKVLTQEERIVAIAKMLSGEKPTAAALENAREMVMN